MIQGRSPCQTSLKDLFISILSCKSDVLVIASFDKPANSSVSRFAEVILLKTGMECGTEYGSNSHDVASTLI